MNFFKCEERKKHMRISSYKEQVKCFGFSMNLSDTKQTNEIKRKDWTE